MPSHRTAGNWAAMVVTSNDASLISSQQRESRNVSMLSEASHYYAIYVVRICTYPVVAFAFDRCVRSSDVTEA